MNVELNPVELYDSDESLLPIVLNRPLLQINANQKLINDAINEIDLRVGIVSLSGPSTVTAGGSYDYTVTDYDEFSSYSVSTDTGSVDTIDGNGVFTLTVPSGTSDGVIVLTLNRDGVDRIINVGVGASAVNDPTFTSPLDGSVLNVGSLTFELSAFSSYPLGFGSHKNTDWQLATDVGFTNIVLESLNDGTNLTKWSVSPLLLSNGTQYYVRAKHRMSNDDVSAWVVLTFTTAGMLGISPDKTTVRTVDVTPSDFSINGSWGGTNSILVQERSGTSIGRPFWSTQMSIKTPLGTTQTVNKNFLIEDVEPSLVVRTKNNVLYVNLTRYNFYSYSYSLKYKLHAYGYASGSIAGAVLSTTDTYYITNPLYSVSMSSAGIGNAFFSGGLFVDDLGQYHHASTHNQRGLTINVYDLNNNFTLSQTFTPGENFIDSFFFDGRYVCVIAGNVLNKYDPTDYTLVATYDLLVSTIRDTGLEPQGHFSVINNELVGFSTTYQYFDNGVFDSWKTNLLILENSDG